MKFTPSKFARLVWLALVCSLCLGAANLRADDKPKDATGKSPASRIEKRTYDFKEAGKEMEYTLFAPSSYDKTKKTPLIIALHGLGSNPQVMIRYPDFTDL